MVKQLGAVTQKCFPKFTGNTFMVTHHYHADFYAKDRYFWQTCSQTFFIWGGI